jgi:zinc protease
MKATLATFTALALLALPVHAETVEKTLANGLRVIVKTDHRAPVVVNQVWYKAGSMDETYGVTGVAHVLEHMMFKGTKEVPSGEFSKRIAAVGGRENAFTNRDHTAYFQTLQKDRLELAMKLEADRMHNLILSADEFAKEINVVMEERRMRTEDSPHSRLYEALMAAAYQTHPYHHPVIGWMQDLKNMTVDDARRWYENWYAPNNATVVIAGDVEPTQVFAWAEKYFGVLPAHVLPVRKAVAEVEQVGQRRLGLKAPAKLPAVFMAWQVPRITEPEKDVDPYALEILAGVLDGHASARLNQSLVREKQLATEVGAGYDSVSRGPALFLLDGTPAEGKSAAEVEQALKNEIARLVKEGISDSELNRVKAQVLAGQVFQQDSLFYQAMQIGEWATAGLDYRGRETRYAKLKAVTAEEVRAVARKYLTDDRLTVAVLDPQPLPAGKPAFGANPLGAGHVR